MNPPAPIAALARTVRPALALLAAALLLPAAAADPVRLGGTGAALGTMAALARAYAQVEPSFRLHVVPNLGSSGGLKALAAGSIHIAVSGRAPKPEESAAGLRAVEYGRTAFVLATTKDG
ncbi:MAG TPA: substrate-binding domain-containing protein, partial [Albitalea sp.]